MILEFYMVDVNNAYFWKLQLIMNGFNFTIYVFLYLLVFPLKYKIEFKDTITHTYTYSLY